MGRDFWVSSCAGALFPHLPQNLIRQQSWPGARAEQGHGELRAGCSHPPQLPSTGGISMNTSAPGRAQCLYFGSRVEPWSPRRVWGGERDLKAHPFLLPPSTQVLPSEDREIFLLGSFRGSDTPNPVQTPQQGDNTQLVAQDSLSAKNQTNFLPFGTEDLWKKTKLIT